MQTDVPPALPCGFLYRDRQKRVGVVLMALGFLEWQMSIDLK